MVPVIIGILSAGRTPIEAGVAAAAGVSTVLHEDLPGPGEPLPEDNGLVTLLLLLGEIFRQGVPRPIRYAIAGGAWNVDHVEQGFTRLLEAGSDVIAWWTILPGDADGEARFGRLLEQASERQVAVLFPGPARLAVGRASALPVHGVVSARPYLDLWPMPPDWQESPAVLSWGEWPALLNAWSGAGFAIRVPRTINPLSGHTLATWSTLALLAMINTGRAQRPPLEELAGTLRTMCLPVAVRPASHTPLLGFFEPRQLQVAADLARLA